MSDRVPPPPPPPPPPLPTAPLPPPPAGPPPRPRWVVPAAAAAAVAVGAGVAAYGLASNSDGGDLAGAPAGLELEDLEPALLTEGDVGRGYAETASDEGDDLGSDQIDASAECREVIERFEDPADDEDLQVDFESGRAAVSHSLSLVDEGDPSVDELVELIDRCRTLAWDDGLTRGEMRLSADEIDGPGDATIEITLALEVSDWGSSVSGAGYYIVSFRDGVASAVSGWSFDSAAFEGSPVDRGFVETLAERADDKVRRVLDA